jgi:hypothetical protein
MRLAAVILLFACQRDAPIASCRELAQYSASGIVLASTEARCAEVLAFGSTVGDKYNMGFSEWLTEVLPQRAAFIVDSIRALTEGDKWLPASFGPTPDMRCGGITVTDEMWKGTVLSKILTARPSKIYVSLSISVEGERATIRVTQDFDCDGKVGLTEVVGRFRKGQPMLAGGWIRLSTKTAEVDE